MVAHAPLVAVLSQCNVHENISLHLATYQQPRGGVLCLRFRPWLVSPFRMSQNRRRAQDLIIYINLQWLGVAYLCIIPAPIITLDIPFHNDLMPSTLDMVAMAFDMPV